MTPIEAWALFFRYAHEAKQRTLVNKLIEERSEIAVASTLLMEISQDDRERARIRSRRMFETDMASNLLTALDRQARDIARNLKSKGIPLEVIVESTGLTIAEVENA